MAHNIFYEIWEFFHGHAFFEPTPVRVMFGIFAVGLFIFFVGLFVYRSTKRLDKSIAFLLFGGMIAVIFGTLFFAIAVDNIQNPIPERVILKSAQKNVTVTVTGSADHNSTRSPNAKFRVQADQLVAGFMFDFELMKVEDPRIKTNKVQVVFCIHTTSGDVTEIRVTPGRDIGFRFNNGQLAHAVAWSETRGISKTNLYRYDTHTLAFWYGRYEAIECHKTSPCMLLLVYADEMHRATFPVSDHNLHMRGSEFGMSFVDIIVDGHEANFIPEIKFDEIQPLAKQKFPKISKMSHVLVFMISLVLSYAALYIGFIHFADFFTKHTNAPSRHTNAKHK